MSAEQEVRRAVLFDYRPLDLARRNSHFVLEDVTDDKENNTFDAVTTPRPAVRYFIEGALMATCVVVAFWIVAHLVVST